MQSVRVYIPDLGESTYRAVEIDDKATVADVQERLIGKLINAGTIVTIDATQFKLFGAKSNSKKVKKLDSNKKIADLTKKWSKTSTVSYKLLFKGISSDTKLPIIQHSPNYIAPILVTPSHPLSIDIPTPTLSSSNSVGTQNGHSKESVVSREQQLPPANDGTQESAIHLLNYFEEEYKNNRIRNMYDIIVALGD